MIRPFIGLVIGFASGAFVAWYIDHQPRDPERYVVTSQSRCLPDDGIQFTLRYNGQGVAEFTIIPPKPAVPTAKEKKDA